MNANPWRDVARVQTERPAPAAGALPGLEAEVRPEANGNARVFLGDAPAGIYASEARAREGVAFLQRLGIAGGGAS